jgi:glycosyltransferase involved in cell wall biosynthesis
MQTDKKIFVVIPAYNEATTIATVIKKVKQVTEHVVVVNDASTDDTLSLAEDAGADCLDHIINRGQGAALKTGIDYALLRGADVIVTFDADDQHSATEIEPLVTPILAGEVDVTLGSRFLNGTPPGIPYIRKLVLKGGIIFTRIFSGIKVTDTHNGFRAFSRSAASTLRINERKMGHASEILDEVAKRFSYREIPVTIAYTEYSKSKGQSSLNSVKIVIKFFLNKLMN